MGSTLRSLVLRYKADLRDFQKGNRRVIDDIKSSKREIVSLDKEMKKAFTPKVDAARAQIKRLNEQFRAGKMDVQKYGSAVDALKQKISAMNRVSAITSHEVGALRGRRVAGANANKALGGAFSGTPGGMSIAQALANAPEMSSPGKGGSMFFGAPTKDMKKLFKKLMPFTGAMAAHKVYSDAKQTVSDMAAKPMGSWDRAAGEAVQPGFDAIGGIHKIPGKVMATGVGALADMLSGGAISRTAGIQGETAKINRRTNEIEQRNSMRDAAMAPQNDFDDMLYQQREIDKLVKNRSVAEMKAAQQVALQKKDYNEVHMLSLAIVEARQQNIAAAKEERAIDEAKQNGIKSMLDDIIKQRQMLELLNTGMSPEAAAVQIAGGSAADVKSAEFLADQVAALNRRREGAGDFADLIGASQDADVARALARKNKIEADAARVGAFGDQFATPQEVFAKNLKEIQSMLSLGLDPAIAHRAMMQNASGLAGSEGKLSRFAPSAEVGSRDEMILREGAKAQSKQQKKMDELVEIQKEALGHAKKNGGEIVVNLTEVNI
jgi:hypothetical protein